MAQPVAAPAKSSARDALRARIQGRAAAKAAAQKVKSAGAKYATLRRIAVEEPQEVDAALTQLSEGFTELGQALQSMKQNLDLGDGTMPAQPGQALQSPSGPTASLKARIAAKKNYASRFRRLADEAPAQFEMAYNEVYQALDGLAEDMENAAANLGITIAPAEEASPFGEGGAPPSDGGAPPFGGDETPAEEHAEEHAEEPPAEGEEHSEEDDEKEASGSDWFVTDRDETGKPNAPQTASARKPVVQVRK
jgi:hypothetical protein